LYLIFLTLYTGFLLVYGLDEELETSSATGSSIHTSITVNFPKEAIYYIRGAISKTALPRTAEGWWLR